MNVVSPRRSFLKRWILFAAVGITATGCTLDVGVNDPAIVVKHTGDAQTGAANTALPVAFEVIVLDQFGNTLQNVTVDWTILAGGGSLSETSNKTVEGGISSVTYTTGPTAGTAQIQAKVSGIPPVIFSVTIT